MLTVPGKQPVLGREVPGRGLVSISGEVAVSLRAQGPHAGGEGGGWHTSATGTGYAVKARVFPLRPSTAQSHSEDKDRKMIMAFQNVQICSHILQNKSQLLQQTQRIACEKEAGYKIKTLKFTGEETL